MVKSGTSFVKNESRLQIALFFLILPNVPSPPFIRDPRLIYILRNNTFFYCAMTIDIFGQKTTVKKKITRFLKIYVASFFTIFEKSPRYF